jgi:hypothetical protein
LNGELNANRCRVAYPRSILARASGLVLLGALGSFSFADLARSADLNEDAAKAASSLPNIYLDLRTIYTNVPAGALAIGFSNPSSVSSVIAALEKLSTLPNVPNSPKLSSPAIQSAGVDVPLTVDVNDRLSVYGGFSASASQSGFDDWSTPSISSWNVGFQADLYEQNGGSFPTVTLQSTLTRSILDSPLATTSLNSVLEFAYALNKDETKGLLAGIQNVAIRVDSSLAKVNPDIIGYVGGYYQWSNNWKLTGRAGVQWFGGAQLANLTLVQAYTQPTLRFDLDRMDDNDNRLFGVTAEILWTPKPAYQLTVRTPIYFVRN